MLSLLSWLLVVAPLVVVPGLLDFARFPQRIFIQASSVLLVLLWTLGGGGARQDAASRRRLDAPVGVFLVLSGLSLAGVTDRAAGVEVLAHWMSCALVYWMVSRLVRHPAQARPLLAGLFGGAAAVALIGLAQAILHADIVPSAAGPAGTLANRNAAAGYLVMALPLGLALWRRGRTAARLSVATGAVAILAFLPFTLARAAAVALAVQVLLLAWAGSASRCDDVSRPRRGSRGGLGRALGAAAAVLLATVVWLTIASPAKARSLPIRVSLAESALSMARESPTLGIGLGRFSDLYPRFGEPIRAPGSAVPLRVGHAHNEVLHVLAESGLPGAIALVWIVAAAFSSLRRLGGAHCADRRSVATALGLALVGFAVDGLFGFPLRTAVGPLGVAVLLGLLSALEANDRPRVKEGREGRAWAVVWRLLPMVLAVSLLPAMARAIHRQADPEGASGESGSVACSAAVDVRVHDGDRIDLQADDVPLGEVLSCLAHRTGLRLEIDGSPPAQRLSASFQDEELGRLVTRLLAGLGVDYLLGFDPSGARLERVILVEASTPAARPSRPASSRAGRRGAPGRGRRMPRGQGEADPVTVEPEESDPDAFGGQGWGLPGDPSGALEGPEGEPPFYDPGSEGPAELSPMTLRGSSGPSLVLALRRSSPGGS